MADMSKWSPVRFFYGDYSVTLATYSPDNVEVPSGVTPPYDSKEYPLNQAGIQVYSNSLNNVKQMALYKELGVNGGYGDRVALLAELGELNVPLYLNGQAVVDSVPQPYVKFEGVGSAVLNYYKADGTLVGPVFPVSLSSNRAVAICGGHLYEDGKFGYNQVGYDTVVFEPHSVLGGYSNFRYDWQYLSHTAPPFSPFQFINADVVDDLWEYLPHEPEGFPMDDYEGDFDASSDSIGIPGVPGINVLQTGFVAMYQMSNTQLQAFSDYLWDGNIKFYDLILKNFQDPMEGIINLSMCPIIIQDSDKTPNANIIVGNVNTARTGTRLHTPYKRIDFGTIYLNEFWGSFADYSPNTKISIFLPYAGVQNLEVNDVMNGGINLWANCDVFTGSIQYFLFSAQKNHRGHGHQSVLYTWSGNMKYNMPFAGSNYNRQIISAVANIPSSIGQTLGGSIDISKMNPMNVLPQGHVQRGGGWGGIVGALGHQYPYLILERPELSMPDNYDHTVGIPVDTTDYLKNYSGYVKVKGVHMEISSATSDELVEIERLLKEGVVI